MSREAARHDDLLLGMSLEAEVEKRAPQGRELESHRAAPLNYREIRRGKMLIESRHVTSDLHILGSRERVRGNPGASDEYHAEIGDLPPHNRERRTAEIEELPIEQMTSGSLPYPRRLRIAA